MQKESWHYRVKAPGEKIRDPIQGEFFSTEAIKNPAEALVREAIQNALDATVKDHNGNPKDILRIRLFLGTGKSALPAKKAIVWFDGTWDHFEAVGNGLREPPSQTEPCAYLVFEDFSTTGLVGNVTQCEPIDGAKNSFFYFFRAEGRSEKGGDDRGRWGIGKHVFPRSSRANTFFGLTVRANDRQKLLMGHSVFKSHRSKGQFYCPDGYMGIEDKSGLILPIDDQETLNQFSKDFAITRTNEPGLSVVVPWVDDEITAEALIEAVVRGYFYPILTGALAVTVETPEKTLVIDDSTLDEAALSLNNGEGEDLLNLVELAEWASGCKPNEIVKLNACKPDRPLWSDDLIPLNELKPLRDSLEKGEKVAIRATLTVRPKGKPEKLSYFDFFLWKDGFESGRPVFIREGLIISGMQKTPRARGVRSFVVIESGPLGTLLGDSENPAHTEWQHDGENYRGKYVNGASYITFVTRIVSQFIQALAAQEQEEDKSLLLNIFSLPSTPTEEKPKRPEEKKKKKKGDESDPFPDGHEPRKKRFRVQKADGGFTVTRGDTGMKPPSRLNIRVAYDSRRGNPLKRPMLITPTFEERFHVLTCIPTILKRRHKPRRKPGTRSWDIKRYQIASLMIASRKPSRVAKSGY
jgi:hypothetical protein